MLYLKHAEEDRGLPIRRGGVGQDTCSPPLDATMPHPPRLCTTLLSLSPSRVAVKARLRTHGPVGGSEDECMNVLAPVADLGRSASTDIALDNCSLYAIIPLPANRLVPHSHTSAVKQGKAL